MTTIAPSVDTALADMTPAQRSTQVSTTWTRVGASMTVVWPSTYTQSGASGQFNPFYSVMVISDPTVIAVNAIVTGVNTSTTVVTLPCNNAGATSGTITLQGADVVQTLTPRLTIDCHTVYGPNGSQQSIVTGVRGNITVDSTKCRIIPFSGGSGAVPAGNTVISQDSASGKLVNVYAALNAAPVLAGQAMPTDGYIMVRRWNGTSFTAGALTGISATALRSDLAGWLDMRLMSVSGVGWTGIQAGGGIQSQIYSGDWWAFLDQTTSGSNATGYQIPTNGFICYSPGVEVETAPGSGIYEFYANAVDMAATAANFSTDIRSKFCWISTSGVVTFQNDQVGNTAGGFLPAAGCKLRVPNIFITTVAQTAWVPTVQSSLSNWTSSNIGTLTVDCVMSHLIGNLFSGGLSLSVSNFHQALSTTANIVLSPLSDTTLINVNAGPVVASNNPPLTTSVSQSKVVYYKCAFIGYQSANLYIVQFQSVGNQIWNYCKIAAVKFRSNTSAGGIRLFTVTNSTFNNCIIQQGVTLQTCSKITFKDCVYYDRNSGQTNPTAGMHFLNFANGCPDCTLDGLTFLVPGQAPYGYIVNSGDPLSGFKLRNIGSPTAPLNLGGPEFDVTWTRSATTLTINFPSAHGMSVSDTVYLRFLSDTAVANKTSQITIITVPTETSITINCNNAGATSGTATIFKAIAQGLYAQPKFGPWAVQRVYTTHARQINAFMISGSANSAATSGGKVEKVWTDPWHVSAAPIIYSKDSRFHGLLGQDGSQASQPLYGNYWSDYYYSSTVPAATSGVAWTRAAAVITVTSAAHGIFSSTQINVTATSSAGAMNLGVATVNSIDANTFSFTGLNAGATSGTLSFQPINGKVAVTAAIPTVASAGQSILTGNAGIASDTRQIALTAPGDTWTVISPEKILGFTAFAISEVSGITATTCLVTYSTDNGATWHSLSRPLSCSGTSGASTITVPVGALIEAGDYVFGAGQVGYNARVLSVSGTTATLDTPNASTFSNQVLRFNHIQCEVISASTGFDLRVKFETISGAQALSTLSIPMYADAAALLVEYPLDPVTLTVTCLDASTGSPIQNAAVRMVASGGGPAADGTVLIQGTTNASGKLIVSNFAYVGDQYVSGTARKGTAAPYYKAQPLSGTITSAGLGLTVYMIKDQ